MTIAIVGLFVIWCAYKKKCKENKDRKNSNGTPRDVELEELGGLINKGASISDQPDNKERPPINPNGEEDNESSGRDGRISPDGSSGGQPLVAVTQQDDSDVTTGDNDVTAISDSNDDNATAAPAWLVCKLLMSKCIT